MKNLRKHSKLISAVAGAGLFLFALAVVMFYIYKRCRSEFNADFTDTLLWANASVESGRFFNPDYWYAYFLPFSGIPIMIPLVAAFGLTYFTHQLGMTIFVILFALALVVFMRAMNCNMAESLAFSGLTMLFMCSSAITRMIFYGHVIHYSLAVVFMCVAFALFKKVSSKDSSQTTQKRYLVILSIWCMLCCTNGIATLLLFFIPFAGSLVLERYLDKEPISYSHDRSLVHTIAALCAGALAGYVIKLLFFSSSSYEDSITALLPSDGWVYNQSPFLLEWIKVFTDDSASDVYFQSFDGIRILCMYVLALLALIFPVFALISYKNVKDRMLRLLTLHYTVMFAVTLITYSVSYASVSNWRLCHLACASLMLMMLYVRYMLKERQHVRWYVLLIPVLAVSAFIPALSVKMIPSAIGTNETDKLIGIYREHGLTRGYASSFWNSTNSANVLSDGEIIVSPIFIYPDGSYEVRRYQSEPWEYEDAPGVDRYFLVIDGRDMEFAADTLGKHVSEEIKFQDDLYIWVFDQNIFKDLEPVYTAPTQE